MSKIRRRPTHGRPRAERKRGQRRWLREYGESMWAAYDDIAARVAAHARDNPVLFDMFTNESSVLGGLW